MHISSHKAIFSQKVRTGLLGTASFSYALQEFSDGPVSLHSFGRSLAILFPLLPKAVYIRVVP